MQSHINSMKNIILILILSFNSFVYPCTRVLYTGQDGIVVTGRNMDWPKDMASEMWLFPRNLDRDGAAGINSMKWNSRYASVATSAYHSVVTEGWNEKRLMVNMLYLTESEYPQPTKNDPRKALSVAAWAQYILDNFGSVDEAVKELRKDQFYIVQVPTPTGEAGQVHLALSDASGDSAILEYVKQRLVIHHGKEYKVMTNSPTYDQQLAIDSYWQQIGGTVMLPGTSRAADRFVRASYYIKIAPQTANIREALATVFSIMRNASTPMGVSIPSHPNNSPTIWRSYFDHKNMTYYFEPTNRVSMFWVSFSEQDFANLKDTKRLMIDNNTYSGDVSGKFTVSEPLKFLSN